MLKKLSPFALLLGLAMLLPQGVSAQLGLPSVPAVPQPIVSPDIDDLKVTDAVIGERLDGLSSRAKRTALRLLNSRNQSLDRLLTRNRDLIERDARGDLAKRGRLLVTGLNTEQQNALVGLGFRVAEVQAIEGIDLEVVVLSTPTSLDLASAEELAQRLAPDAQISADNLHYKAGQSVAAPALPIVAMQSSGLIATKVGMIDGAPSKHVRTTASRGFAKGAPFPSNHGSAVASLLKRAGVAKVQVADVYGTDPAGGNALAIVKGIGWLTQSGSRVITISLVGPRNNLVSAAIKSAQRKGVVIVAAVGNDGPAAPPAYPASYSGVIAITGTDKKGRQLIEAGRAKNLDYAAPGADIYGSNKRGKRVKLRGTSFATPLAAARIAAARQRSANWRRLVDAEARDLGSKGPDSTFGRGLLCGACARRK